MANGFDPRMMLAQSLMQRQPQPAHGFAGALSNVLSPIAGVMMARSSERRQDKKRAAETSAMGRLLRAAEEAKAGGGDPASTVSGMIAENPDMYGDAGRAVLESRLTGVLSPASERKTAKDVTGRLRYMDSGEAVFPGVEAPKEPPKTRTVTSGTDVVTEEWDPERGVYTEYARGPKGSGVSVNVGPGESAEAKEVGKWYGEQYAGMQEAARSARRQNARLDAINTLLEDVYTGTGGEAVLAGKKLAAMMGADPEGIGDAEAARALGNELSLEMRNPAGGAGMPGAMSDKDREFLAGMNPNLSMTKEGRETLIKVRKRLNQRNIEVARAARKYRQKHGRLDEGFYDLLDDKFASEDLFADLAAAPEAAAPTRMRFDAQGNLIE